MQLTKQQLDKFKDLYNKRFGEELSDEQAAYKAGKLIELMELIYKPLTKEEYKKYSGGDEADKE